MAFVALPFIWLFGPGVTAPGPRSAALAVFAGVLYMSGLAFYLWALQFEGAPFYQATPLLGYALGYFVLGETLSNTQLIGGAEHPRVEVQCAAGSRDAHLRAVDGSKLPVFKIFALRDQFWPTTFWMYAGEAAVASYRSQFVGRALAPCYPSRRRTN